MDMLRKVAEFRKEAHFRWNGSKLEPIAEFKNSYKYRILPIEYQELANDYRAMFNRRFFVMMNNYEDYLAGTIDDDLADAITKLPLKINAYDSTLDILENEWNNHIDSMRIIDVVRPEHNQVLTEMLIDPTTFQWMKDLFVDNNCFEIHFIKKEEGVSDKVASLLENSISPEFLREKMMSIPFGQTIIPENYPQAKLFIVEDEINRGPYLKFGKPTNPLSIRTINYETVYTYLVLNSLD